MSEPTQVWGVAVLAPKQKAAAEAHCFGDCGKISMAGVIDDAMTGGLFVCCEPVCPYMAQEMPGYGTTVALDRRVRPLVENRDGLGMQLTLIDKEMLRTTIASNTDATEQDAAQIINTVLLKQRKCHTGECEQDSYSRDVCEGMYAEKCDDVIGLCDALRAVLALAGENKEVRRVIEAAIAEHGGPDVA